MTGFITLHRAILEWEWYQETNTKVLFIHCLLKANWEDKNWQGLEIKRGSFITSVNNLSFELGLTVQQVRTAINKLSKTNELTIKTTNKNTLLTIVKYDVYQNIVSEDNKQNNKQPNKQNNKRVTNEQQSNNNQITTTKQDNNLTIEPITDLSLFQSDVMENIDVSIEVIKYLNLKKGNKKGYEPTNGNLVDIKARLKEGFKLEDFKKVIDFKIANWSSDVKMKKYIRPETLFASKKFNSYVIEAEESTSFFDKSSSSNFIEKEATESDLI